MARILVTGGAGFIGAHMVAMLISNKHEVVVLDSLVTGCRKAVLNATLIVADLANCKAIESCFAQYDFDAVMHFASFIQVGESILEPVKYYQNNITNSLNLLNTMRRFDVKKLIFSSSAAIYGEPQYIPIDINH